MPIPLVGAALGAASRYLATKGVKAAIKKYGKAAIKTIKESEKGISSRAGSKKGLDAIKGTTTRNRGKGFGLKQAGTPKMATKAQRAANVSSGRKRLGTAATVGFLGMPTGGDEKNITVDTSKPEKKTKQEKKVTTGPVGGERKVTKESKVNTDWKNYKTIAEAKKEGSNFYSKGGKKMAAVFKEDLAEGQSLRDLMNKKLGKTRIGESLAPKEKRSGRSGGMKSGGKVRGYGIARGGKACKMR
jgi:cytochrome c5